jgi:hypothetical protein
MIGGKESRGGNENEELNINRKKTKWIASARWKVKNGRMRTCRAEKETRRRERKERREMFGKQISQRSDDVNIALYCDGLCGVQWFIAVVLKLWGAKGLKGGRSILSYR